MYIFFYKCVRIFVCKHCHACFFCGGTGQSFAWQQPDRLHRGRKRGELQASPSDRVETWSNFHVGHHGLHHTSHLAAACVLFFYPVSFDIFFYITHIKRKISNENLSIPSSSTKTWGLGSIVFFYQSLYNSIDPRRSLANSLATWAHRPDWNSQTCPTDWLQSLKCPPQDGAAGSSHLLSCCVFVLSFCWTPLPQDGDKSWHTWPSARFLRISLLELLLQQETLDSKSWQHLILRRRQKNWTQSWRTAALQWWRSSACSSRTSKHVNIL